MFLHLNLFIFNLNPLCESFLGHFQNVINIPFIYVCLPFIHFNSDLEIMEEDTGSELMRGANCRVPSLKRALWLTLKIDKTNMSENVGVSGTSLA